MLLAMVLFGLMATFSKDVLANGGITGPQLVAFRVIGAAIIFWLGSLIVPQQRIEPRDFIKIAGAGFFGFALAQGGYIVGLSFTSPINATIELTTMPIFTLILSASCCTSASRPDGRWASSWASREPCCSLPAPRQAAAGSLRTSGATS